MAWANQAFWILETLKDIELAIVLLLVKVTMSTVAGFDWKHEIVKPKVLELHWNPVLMVTADGKVRMTRSPEKCCCEKVIAKVYVVS